MPYPTLPLPLTLTLTRRCSPDPLARRPHRARTPDYRQTDRQFGRKTHSEQLGCCATHLRRYKCNVSPPKRHLRRG
eukprot:scaffold51372_cov58-Phaeocystis_antarctica.AAC.2